MMLYDLLRIASGSEFGLFPPAYGGLCL